MHKIILLICFIFSLNSYATLCDQEETLNRMAVQNNGRIKPYMVAANEFLKTISGATSFNDMSASKVFCQLSFLTIAPQNDLNLMMKIEHVDSKKLLGLEDGEHSIEIHKALGFKEIIRSEIMGIKQSTSYKKSLNKIWYKIDTFEKAISGQLWTTPVVDGTKVEWVNALSVIDQDSYAKNGLAELQKNNKNFNALGDNTIMLEYRYAKSHLFSYAMILVLIGIFATVLIKKYQYGLITAWSVILLEVIGLTIRVLISGRAPITNMYETVLFSGFGALFISLIIFHFKRDKIFILGGLGYNILCLFMMKFADGMLDETINPLVPVLRDNFWLSTHVTTIILSYAALALSWILANMTLIRQRFGNITTKDYRYYESLVYTSVKVGIVLLATGIILGGVWADYSWGRFWGWDPKETWSLIVLLFYMAILHGKNTSWINTHRFIVLTAAGFMTVMMAWFGVNYILASGLHSYGFSEGGAIFLGTFFIAQIVMIIITGFNKTRKL